MKNRLGLAALFSIISVFPSAADETVCTYTDWAWNADKGRAEAFREIEKPRAALSEEERHDSLDCSVCREDQAEIALPGIAPFRVCRAVAGDVETALLSAMKAGFSIEKVVGYRVGRTKGLLDAHGLRTGYSNHSFGLAIDVNPDRNGLYGDCLEFSSQCRLIRGGEWAPAAEGAVTRESPLYRELTAIGWRWGGELAGRQKDFMHFSPSGD